MCPFVTALVPHPLVSVPVCIVFVLPNVSVSSFCDVLRVVPGHPSCLSYPMLPRLGPSFLQCLLVSLVWYVPFVISTFAFSLHFVCAF